jgi:CheY-like chemotaxis protein
MRSTLKRILKGENSEFVECANGIEAVAAYDKERPEWVVMDLKMPMMDGLTATREITNRFPNAKVIIITSGSNADVRQAASEAGGHAFVPKENLIAIRGIIYPLDSEKLVL